MRGVRLLLPPAARFGGQRLGDSLARAVGQADVLRLEGAQAARCFTLDAPGWPAAAVSRQADAGDAAGHLWLRADPCHVRPDINGARLLAHGPALALDADEAAALLPDLRDLFAEEGMELDAPHPGRWYLKLPPETLLPVFSTPDEALGEMLLDHLPGGDSDEAVARRWRALMSEVQVLLHNNPCNAARAGRGRAPVNALWFWGAGRLPRKVECDASRVLSDDATLGAFARQAGGESQPLPGRAPPGLESAIVDLRDARDLQAIQVDWLHPLLDALRSGDLPELLIDGEDGRGFRLRRRHRLRFWRSPRHRLAEA